MPRLDDKLLEHFQHPRNVGVLADESGVATVNNPQCGDTMKLFIRIEGEVISDVRWQTRGCSSAIAASSAASEIIKGLSIAEARQVTRQAIADALGGLPPARMHGSILAVDAVRAALRNYEGRRAAGPSDRANSST